MNQKVTKNDKNMNKSVRTDEKSLQIPNGIIIVDVLLVQNR
jgi:hypothetical protein